MPSARAPAALLDVGTALTIERKKPASHVTGANRAHPFRGVARSVRQAVLLSRHLAGQRPLAETAADPPS